MRSSRRRKPRQDADRALNFYEATDKKFDADYIGCLWHVLGLARMISTEVDRIVRQLGLSAADLTLLGTIRVAAPDALRPTDLAAKLHISSAALSPRIARLIQLGLIARNECAADRRAMELRLTDAGTTLSDRVTAEVAAQSGFARRFRQLAEEEREMLTSMLGKLHDLVDRDFVTSLREFD